MGRTKNQKISWTGQKKQDAINKILAHVAAGGSVNSICQEKDMPSKSTFFDWVHEAETGQDKENSTLADQYTKARNIQAEVVFDEMTDLDGMLLAKKITPFEHKALIDSQKWRLGRMKPVKYGDTLRMTADSKAAATIEIKYPSPDDSTNNGEH